MAHRSFLRPSLIGALVIGGGCLLGGMLSGGALADGRAPDDHLRMFGQVFSLVEDNYVGDTDPKELVEGAIEGMLRTLDPHSNYLPPEAYSEMKDEQRGKFYGLGIQIAKRGPDKPLTIIAPIDDTPASRAGLLAGDVIYKIEGEMTIDLTVQEAVRRLKGPKGSEVTITIQRPADGSEFDVAIVRGEVPIESLRVAYMLRPDVGYVAVSNFTSSTTPELDAALASLRSQGMKKLVLDLRENPGGLLDQAVKVAERFIPEGKLLVYTRGRIPGSDQDYFAENDIRRLDMPVVVLVDNGSASASEIVSGAIQDHDRGLVVGETTFGKGLVQRVIPLRNGGALAVTTAKYYTPSGRLIQRDYTDLEEYFMHRSQDEGAEGAMEDTPREERDVHYTSSGRKVYGGGGITPDYEVDSEPLPTLVARMMRENLIFDFAVRFNADHEELEHGFQISDEYMKEFRGFLGSREFEYDAEEFDEHLDVIALRLRAQVSRVRWDRIEEARILSEADAQLQKALSLFEEAANLAKAGALGTPGNHHASVDLDGTERVHLEPVEPIDPD